MSKRKQHALGFKAKVALEALKGEETVSGLCCTNRLLSGLPLSPDRPIPRPL